jgi:hypothetical protein
MCQPMTTKRQREIVIEFEKVQLIRKRAKTTLGHCELCNAESDFVGIRSAAELFGITAKDLTQFVVNSAVHYANEEFGTAICVASLLSVMQEKAGGGGVRLIGD